MKWFDRWFARKWHWAYDNRDSIEQDITKDRAKKMRGLQVPAIEESPSWKGREKTESHRKNLSLAHMGKKLSEETKRKIIETKQKNNSFKSGMEGKTHSEETKKKISQAKKKYANEY